MDSSSLVRFVEIGKKIVGVGLNYRSLVKERGVSLPTKPLVFMKATTSYTKEGQAIELPPGNVINYEIELGIIIGKTCKKVSEADAMKYIGGYCLALDMTDVTEIDQAKKEGTPWALGKAFDTACPVSRFITKDELPDPCNARIWCSVNGQKKQDGTTSDLIFSIPYLISHISQRITLEPGDLLLTGSPAGVGPLRPGETIEGGINDILTMKFNASK